MVKRARAKTVTFGGISYQQTWNCRNPDYRHEWIAQQIAGFASAGGSVLDVGAGPAPYRRLVEDSGFRYAAHDFAEYVPQDEAAGLQNAEWPLTRLDFVCDILDIPETEQYSIVICTEVLEHVPDPVASLEKLTRLVAAGGILLVSVPFLSLMHQAPYWHASGLSPYFFSHWVPRFGLSLQELTVHGDYVDLMAQESARTFRGALGRTFGGAMALGARAILLGSRSFIADDILSSGGFGVTLRASAREHQPTLSNHSRG